MIRRRGGFFTVGNSPRSVVDSRLRTILRTMRRCAFSRVRFLYASTMASRLHGLLSRNSRNVSPTSPGTTPTDTDRLFLRVRVGS